MVNDSNLRTQRTLRCPVCGVPTLHHFCIRKNGCDVLACSACGVGRADTTNFDPAWEACITSIPSHLPSCNRYLRTTGTS